MQTMQDIAGGVSVHRRRLAAWAAVGALGALCAGATARKGLGLLQGQDGAHTGAAAPVKTAASMESNLLCSARNAAGVGLRGEYFGKEGRQGPALLVRTDSEVACAALRALAQPPGGEPARSARWSGWVKAPLAGRYSFHFDHADARIVVGNLDFSLRAVANGPQPAAGQITALVQGQGQATAPQEPPAQRAEPVWLEMEAGRFYAITVELDRLDRLGGPGDGARLEWTPPHGHRFPIARAMLFLPMG